MPKRAAEIPQDEANIPVMLPSGAKWEVHPDEQAYFDRIVRRYKADTKFTIISDEQDLDRIVMMETLVWRYQTWLSRGEDYWQGGIDEKAFSSTVKDTSMEIRRIKESIGLDKESRDAERGEGSVSDYLQKLLVRAKAFGVMRQKQFHKALDLWHEVEAKATVWRNATPEERQEMHWTAEETLDWILDVAKPEFDDVDLFFRQGGPNAQRSWIAEM